MKIAIVGSGIAGMSLGYYLGKAGHNVTVYEKEKDLGGLARSFLIESSFLEEYYHHIFLNDVYTVQLIEELGLNHRLVWERSKMGVYCEGKVYPFGTPFDILKFKPFSVVDKIRFALSTQGLIARKNYTELENVSAEKFLINAAGENVYKKIWEPLLATKFGKGDYKEVTAGWLYARVNARGKSKRGIFEREILGYLEGSLKVLFDKLESKIIEEGGAVRKNSPINKIELDKAGKVAICLNNARGGPFDICCLCIPNPIIVDITKNLFDESYMERLKSIKYRAVLCIVLLIEGGLSPYYWINISQKGIPFTGMMEHTNLVSRDKYNKNDIIYLSRYISADEPQYNMRDDELVDLYSGHIKDIFPKFDKSSIKRSFVFKNLYAQPIVTKGHKDRMPHPTSPLRNIFINNTSQIYPEDRGISPGIKQSLELSKIIGNAK